MNNNPIILSEKNIVSNSLCKVFVLSSFFVFFLYNSEVYAELFVYPNKGQSVEQLNQDKFECYEWAKQHTGIDPMRLETEVTPTKVPKRGGIFRGAGRGAVLGVIGGAIGGDAGKGAAIGAGVGAFGGAIKKRQSEQEQMRTYEEANKQKKALRETFDRAYRACLEGRDYTVR